MARCERPLELPVQFPQDGDGLFYCPVKISKGIKIGYADPSVVKCDHLAECKALHAVLFNHSTSNDNTNYKARPAKTATEVKTEGFPVATHRKNYPKDFLLFFKDKRKKKQ